MEPWLLPIAFLFGAAAGGVIAWLALRTKASGEQAALAERLQARDLQIEELRRETESARVEGRDLRESLRAEAERRAAAEQRTGRIAELEEELRRREETLAGIRTQNAELGARLASLSAAIEKERKGFEEKQALLDQARETLADAFKALSSEALRKNNQSFLELAKANLETIHEAAKGELGKRQQAIEELVKPVRETLAKMDEKMQGMEKERVGSYEALRQQLSHLADSERQLRSETSSLVQALRSPRVRGNWGEMQLRRVVELAGMVDRCDFQEQVNMATEEGRQRPDMVIRLPGGHSIAVDAKAPLAGYLEALDAPDEDTRLARMRDHARQVRDKITELSRRAYWNQLDSSPDFVVLFLPGETFYLAALEHEPGLIEMAMNQKVLLASPTTLIALLRAAAYGWRQEDQEKNARAISALGRELYERLGVMAEHWERVGRGLNSAIDAYNRAVGSMESRVLVSARRFRELSVGESLRDIPNLSPIEQRPRALQAPEIGGENPEGGSQNED